MRRVVALAALALSLGGCLPPDSRAARGGSDGGGPGAIGAVFDPSPTTAAVSSAAPSASPSFVRPTPTPAPTFAVYTVASGDNLNTIAHKFGTSARSIAFWNRAPYPSLDPESSTYQPGLLKVGWTLQLIPNVTVDEQMLPEPSAAP